MFCVGEYKSNQNAEIKEKNNTLSGMSSSWQILMIPIKMYRNGQNKYKIKPKSVDRNKTVTPITMEKFSSTAIAYGF